MSIIALASNTLSSPAGAGQIEYNGKIFAATPTSTQRGIIPTEQFFALNSGLAGANATGAQNIFGVGVTLSASTVYEFEITFALNKTAGTTSHSIGFGFGGTVTVNNISWQTIGNFAAGSPPASALLSGTDQIAVSNSVANLTISPVTTTAAVTFFAVIKGTVSINAGGTFIPQYTLSAAPGGAYTTQAGSYMKIKPIGPAGSNVAVGTWA